MTTLTKGDKVKVAQSNGLSFRDSHNGLGTILYKIPNETVLTVIDTYQVVDCVWINVKYRNLSGWAVADNGMGITNVKALPKPKKPKRRYRKSLKAKKTGSP